MFVRPASGHRPLACAHPAAGERRRWLRQDSSAADRRARRVASSVSGTTLATGDDPREGLPQANTNGATGVTPSSEGMIGRKRRGSDSHIRHVLDGTVVIAVAPERSRSGVSRRESYQRPRPRKLTINERDAVRLEADKARTLRTLAAEFGVTHETIRAILRDRGCGARVVVPGAPRRNAHPCLFRPFQRVKQITGNETVSFEMAFASSAT